MKQSLGMQYAPTKVYLCKEHFLAAGMCLGANTGVVVVS